MEPEKTKKYEREWCHKDFPQKLVVLSNELRILLRDGKWHCIEHDTETGQWWNEGVFVGILH